MQKKKGRCGSSPGNSALTNQLAPFSSPYSNQESDMIQPTPIGTTPSRSNLVQVFRALAIIAVVMFHTSPPGYGQVFIRPFINFAVATFLFLSGYLTKIENDDWPHFYKKRILMCFMTLCETQLKILV